MAPFQSHNLLRDRPNGRPVMKNRRPKPDANPTAPGIIVAGWALLVVSLALAAALAALIVAQQQVLWHATLLPAVALLAGAGFVLTLPEPCPAAQ